MFFKFFQSIFNSIFSENISGKVVLITGASSGIGEHLAYEYASKGACLALVARRQNQLREVVEQAREIGSPDVLMIVADVSKVEDCKRLVDDTIDHFGRLDHLVNNAGINSVSLFDEITNITSLRNVMDTNFWGSAYTTHFAIPHLKQSKGKIVVLSSSASWLPIPRMSLYNASKAALFALFETLRVELGQDIKITLVTPGFIESELTQGKFLDKEGKMIFDPDLRDVQVSAIPVGTCQGCAKGIVKSALKGQRYLTEPSWFKVTYIWKVFCPEILEWGYRLFYLNKPGTEASETPSKKILDVSGAKNFLYPDTLQAPQELFKSFFIKIFIPTQNLAGKVVLITGASSGIGENLAYEYARRGANLALAARRENRLKRVADEAIRLGSPDAIVIRADVKEIEDCKALVEDTVNHFGQLDYLVNNAGVVQLSLFEDSTDQFSTIRSIMASKAAQLSFFETLKAEFGSDIGVTIVTPGLIESEMTGDQFWSKSRIKGVPVESGERCAKAIVESACRGDMYLIEPSWCRVGYWFKFFFPQLVEKCFHLTLIHRPWKRE
ncbi:hypothetical protein F8388_007593 [Cannabis sativa]|uniref:Ketoreductase domain-containing protein n=1 Tax=Cannabis sativa TaxID=3483 RepID=A0A7J6ET15_CANSA|nr:hypothetical protein F8388_007593 [Cannabis sativa]